MLYLKVQYPGVADSIDSDLSIFKHLLKLPMQYHRPKHWMLGLRRSVSFCTVKWIIGLRQKPPSVLLIIWQMMSVIFVPTIYDNYSTNRLICMSFEAGISLNDQSSPPYPKTVKMHLDKPPSKFSCVSYLNGVRCRPIQTLAIIWCAMKMALISLSY